MIKNEAVNTFTGGLIMDLNPISTPNNVLTNCLNGTLITYNGNEYTLQNDMGNGRVESAYLPQGYIPIGTTELGGIIYIVSYNPLANKCQIGSFPSPERNVFSSDVQGALNTLTNQNFISNNVINNTSVKLKLSDTTLHAGDKFIICSDDLIDNYKSITDCYNTNPEDFKYSEENPRYLNLSIATIDSNGRIIKLSNLKKYEANDPSIQGNYIIAKGSQESFEQDIDTYRKTIESAYNIFSSKISGQLYIVAELELIDKFNITYKCIDYTDIDPDTNGPAYTLQFQVNTAPDNLYIQYLKIEERNSENIFSTFYYYEREEGETTTLTFERKFSNIPENKIIDLYITPCMKFGEYQQYQTQLSIDFSLLGTGIFTNTLWKYYKNDNSMLLNWNLNANPIDTQEIVSVTIFAREFDSEKDIIIETINNRNSYSGSITSLIEFSDEFKPDTLYFCKIQTKIFDQTTNGYIDKNIYKCLYTNGIFNSVYTEDINKTDYDLISPELHYTLDFQQVDNISRSMNTKVQELCSDTEIDENIRGAEVNRYSGNIKLTPIIGFQDNYNSFSVDENNVSVEIQEDSINNTIDWKVEKSSTNVLFKDDEYMDIQPSVVDEVTEGDDYSLMKDQYSAKVSQEGNTINVAVDGLVYNKVTSNSILNNVNVTNYITPIVYNQETALKYGLEVSHATTEGSHFHMTNQFFSIGMSGGGGDSTGTGNIYYLSGSRRLVQGTEGKLGYTAPELLTEKETLLSSEDIQYTTSLIKTDLSIIPVIITNIGNGQAKLKDSLRGNPYYIHTSLTDSSDYLLANGKVNIPGPSDSDRLTAFRKTADDLNFITVQLFMKQQNGNITATNNYFPITNINTTIAQHYYADGVSNPTNAFPENTTMGDIIGATLVQLYVNQGANIIQGYTVNDIEYYSTIKETWNTSMNLSLKEKDSITTNNIIKLKDTLMTSIQEAFKEYSGMDNYKCLQITSVIDDSYNHNIEYNISLPKSDLLDEYLVMKDSPKLDTYIITINDQKVTLESKVTQSDVYYINNGKLNVCTSMPVSYVSNINNIKYLPDEDKIKVTFGSIRLLQMYGNKFIFYWDYREKLLKIKDSIVSEKVSNPYYLYYYPKSNPGDVSRSVSHPDIPIFTLFNIVY